MVEYIVSVQWFDAEEDITKENTFTISFNTSIVTGHGIRQRIEKIIKAQEFLLLGIWKV